MKFNVVGHSHDCKLDGDRSVEISNIWDSVDDLEIPLYAILKADSSTSFQERQKVVME